MHVRGLGQAAVAIAGDEPYAPCQRPRASKAFLSGSAEAATLQSRSAEQYEREGITRRLREEGDGG